MRYTRRRVMLMAINGKLKLSISRFHAFSVNTGATKHHEISKLSKSSEARLEKILNNCKNVSVICCGRFICLLDLDQNKR